MTTRQGTYSFRFHVSSDERSNIQIWFPIEIQFIMDKLVSGIGGDPFLGNRIFRNSLYGTITRGIWCRNTAVNMGKFGISKVATEVDDLFGIDVLNIG